VQGQDVETEYMIASHQQ